jgi:glycosyltransferase involved in cell wall biosynthesis
VRNRPAILPELLLSPRTPTVFATNPNDDLYGASRVYLETVLGLLDAGWRVVVSVPEPNGDLVERIRAAGGEVRRVPSPVVRKTYLTPRGLVRLVVVAARAIPAGLRLLRDVRPDVIYVNTVIQPLWPLLGWCLRIPVVCHVHEAEASMPRAIRATLSLPLLFARRVIVNSRVTERVLATTLPRASKRSVVVHNGVVGPPAVADPRAALDPPLQLLYVGRLSERKGVGDAIEAVRLLGERATDCRLEIVGAVFTGRDVVERDLRRQADDAGLSGRVRFAGFEPVVWPRLAAADVAVVPSRTDESFGNTAVEALLAARPVITTSIPGLVEATEGFRATLAVPPSDPEALADAIQDVAGAWARFRQGAIEDAPEAAERYSPASYRHAVALILSELVSDDGK